MVCFLSSAPSLCSSLLNKGPRLWVPLSAQPEWRAHPLCFQFVALTRVVTVPVCLFYLLYFMYHCTLLVSLKEAFKVSIIETRDSQISEIISSGYNAQVSLSITLFINCYICGVLSFPWSTLACRCGRLDDYISANSSLETNDLCNWCLDFISW